MSTIAITPSRTTYRPRSTDRPAARREAVRGAVQGGVRLTRRGRLVLVAAALTAMLVAGFFLGAGSVATQERGTGPATEVVQVAPGETLWDIAARMTPDGGDVRATMFDIKRLNALADSALDAGQRIRVPAE